MHDAAYSWWILRNQPSLPSCLYCYHCLALKLANEELYVHFLKCGCGWVLAAWGKLQWMLLIWVPKLRRWWACLLLKAWTVEVEYFHPNSTSLPSLLEPCFFVKKLKRKSNPLCIRLETSISSRRNLMCLNGKLSIESIWFNKIYEGATAWWICHLQTVSNGEALRL